MDSSQDLYKNTDSTIFIRLSGIYYRREVGKRWSRIPESEAPSPDTWNKLAEVQREVYTRALTGQGVL